MAEPALQIVDLSVHYGGIQAVRNISLSLQAGEQGTLIGSNGAGKSSTVRALCGLQPYTGEVYWQGQSLKNLSPESRVQKGIVLVPEGRGIFTRMTVLENLQMGAWHRHDRAGVREQIEQLMVQFPRLAERKHQLAGLLSGGEQQLLAIARALLSKPKLLILDEPSMGLAPIMVDRIFEVIDALRGTGITLLLIEQNARLALQVTDRAWVMDSGSFACQGRSAELLNDDRIQQIYLGELPA